MEAGRIKLLEEIKRLLNLALPLLKDGDGLGKTPSPNIIQALEIIDTILKAVKNDSPKIGNVCDVCAGTKLTLEGKPCICKDGTMIGLMTGLRLHIFNLEAKVDAYKPMREGIDRMIKQIDSKVNFFVTRGKTKGLTPTERLISTAYNECREVIRNELKL